MRDCGIKSALSRFYGEPIALFTLLLVIVSTLQWCTLQNTDRILRLGQRAVISIEPQNPPSLFDALQAKEESTHASIYFKFSNAGNTGTKNLEVATHCLTLREQPEEPWRFFGQTKDKPVGVPSYIGPKGSATGACAFLLDDLRAVNVGRMHAYAMAEAIYRDGVDNLLRRTQLTITINEVIFSENGRGIFKYSNYGRHNCADEECPSQP